jgi:hypothetical protein
MDEATGVQMGAVDDDAAASVSVLDLQRLDTEVAGKAAWQESAGAFDGDAADPLGVVHSEGDPSPQP